MPNIDVYIYIYVYVCDIYIYMMQSLIPVVYWAISASNGTLTYLCTVPAQHAGPGTILGQYLFLCTLQLVYRVGCIGPIHICVHHGY